MSIYKKDLKRVIKAICLSDFNIKFLIKNIKNVCENGNNGVFGSIWNGEYLHIYNFEYLGKKYELKEVKFSKFELREI